VASVVSAFVGGAEGPWRVERLNAVTGPALQGVERVHVVEGPAATGSFAGSAWVLRGAASYERYVRRVEHDDLAARSPELGRPEATRAALIPISKSSAWWALPQDERREIFEERSHHIATGLVYLPAIARRLHHGRDLGEPFDFLTWFEYASADADAFEDLVARLRRIEHWRYVTREVDIRLVRVDD
jgi:hypothetical protein